MAHELMNNNAMFYVGKTPWHGLGKKLEISPNTDEALKLAKLDWKVYKDETYINVPMKRIAKSKILSFANAMSPTPVETGYCSTYRIDPDKKGSERVVVLGHVSKKYEVLQNEDAFQPFDEVLLDHGYTYETAGAVKDGQKIWILAKAPEKSTIGHSGDDVERYVLLFNSHNGSTGVTMKPTMIRVVCNNTLEYALNKGTDNGIALRHTTGVKDRLASLTSALKTCEGNIDAAVTIMRAMNDAEVNERVMTKYFETVFPTLVNRDNVSFHPITKRKIPNFAKPQYDTLVNNFRHGKGNHGKTMWDAYNAITEYVDHNKNYTDPMSSIGFGWGKNIKQTAFKVGYDLIKD
tara:strand:+ start:27378 stop:28424 length:1047 start_codon:yes stop_codon:yes gene_type:complete